MSPVSEVKTVFTVDLAPFVDGLKTMLSMTETTGQQLNQLLTVNAKPPDYSGLEAQLKGLADRTKEYVGANQSSIASNQTAIPVEQNLTNETGKAEKALFKKSDTLRGMRREAMMGMGALSFLMMSMQQMGDSADGAEKKTSSLTKGLKEGVGAGFEVAMMLLMVNPELGVLAIAIGLVVTVGITLAKVFNDNTEAMNRQKEALDELSVAMRGVSITDLQSYRDGLQKNIDIRQKDINQMKEHLKQHGMMIDDEGEALKKSIKNEQERLDTETKLRDAADAELKSKTKSTAEAIAFTVKAEVDAIADSRKKELADATLTYNKEQDEWKGHHDALVASTEKHNALIAQINKKYDDQEKAQADKDQKESDQEDQKAEKAAEQLANAKQSASDSWFERDLNTMRIQGIQKGLTQEEIDTQSMTAQRARLQNSLNVLNAIIDVNDAGQIKQQADLAKQISAIDAKMAADKAENANKVKAIEQQLVSYVAKLADETAKQKAKEIKAWTDEHQYIIGPMRAGIASWAEGLKGAAVTWNTVWQSMKGSLVDFLADYVAKWATAAIANAAISDSSAIASTTAVTTSMTTIAAAALPAATLVSIASFGAADIAADAGMATTFATSQVLSLVPKFAQGTPPEGFIVPPGYDKDNFMIGVSSGEKVNVQSAMRNTYLPTINKQTMAAPAALRQQDLRDAAVEAVKAQIAISNQSGGASGGGAGNNQVHLNVNVNTVIGTDQYVRDNLKPALEKLMRELGASSIDEVFINKWKNV
jgi:hypothetical protein